MFEKILNNLGYYKKYKGNSYREICYIKLGALENGSERLLGLSEDGHDWIEQRTNEDYQFIGAFFTIILLIEYKLSQLLVGFDPEIEGKMFGRKIDVYKDFLRAYRFEEDGDIDSYRDLISPLKDLKKLRDAMAHDINKSKFAYKDIKHIKNYVKKMRPDLFNDVKDCIDEDAKSMGVMAIFGFIFAVEIARLRMAIA